jgi:tripartite-type tricarboxylate transporter receptor subunit TctC
MRHASTIRARKFMFRFVRAALCAIAAGALAQSPAQAASGEARYPTKPIRLISAFAPGGGASAVARMIGPELTEAWGQPVVVDNRPGAGGSIGTEMAARSPADGYTLVMATASTIVINPLVGKVPFDPLADFAPVVHTSTVPLVLVVHPSVPAKTVKELIAYARSRGARLNFSSSGEGTISHLAGELFNNLAKVEMVHVPYKGGGQAIIDLMAGHVQVGFQNILEALPQINAGRVRALAVSTPARSPVVPNIPTVNEAGVRGYEVIQWSGILAPAGVSRDIVAKLNTEVNRILARPDMRERFIAGGADPGSGSPEQFGAMIRSEIAKWAGVVKTIKLDLQRR